jgi:hypothetical protein
MGDQLTSRPLYPRETARFTHWIGWVGPRAVLDTAVKRIPSPRWESNPRTPIVQSVAQRYTDWNCDKKLVFLFNCIIPVSEIRVFRILIL